MAHDSGYINLFSFADWATSASNALKTSGIGELSTDAARGEITITTGDTEHVWTATGANADYYMIPVRGGTTYDVTWTMSGTSANSQVFYVPMKADRTYCLGGSHPYQSVAPESGPGEKSGSFTTPSDCRYVQLFFDVHDTHKSMTFGDIAVWGKPFVRFGRGDCSPIIVEKFAPICSFDGVEGSEPLALDVPVVPFVPPVPPPECACFTFEKGKTGAVEVEMTCDDKAELHVEVEIEQGCSDCCAGKYTIKPTASLTLPCIPFDIAEADVQIMRRDYKTGGTTAAGPGEVDGTAGFTLERGKNRGENEGEEADCCTLKPTLTVTFPDCVKHFEPTYVYPPDGQVQFYRRNDDPESEDYGKAQLQHKTFIEWFVDREHCSEYPRITTLDIPSCMLPDKNWPAKTVEIRNNNGNTLIGTLTYKVSRVDCAPRVEIGVSKFMLPDPPIYIPPLPCASPNGELTVTAQYVDAAGATKKIANASAGNGKTAKSAIRGSVDTAPYLNCLKYDSDMTLDLGHMYGIGFNNGGGVNMEFAGHTLRINGAATGTSKTWYGGGFGDWKAGASDTQTLRVAYDSPFCRGPLMRFTGGTDPSPALTNGIVLRTVTYEDVNTRFVEIDGNNVTQHQEWTSGRVVDATETSPATWESTANLNIVLPTGVQWSVDGLSLALPLTEFIYNDSGVLSTAKETEYAVRVAPAPLSKLNNGTHLNCSGLASFSYAGDPHYLHEDGLRVNAGKGLWIYGYSGNPAGITGYDSSRQGRLEIAKHDGDFEFVNVTDVDGATCPRLVLNDTVGTHNTSALANGNGGDATNVKGVTVQPWNRDSGNDLTIPVVMFSRYGGAWKTSTEAAGYVLSEAVTVKGLADSNETRLAGSDSGLGGSSYSEDFQNLKTYIQVAYQYIKRICNALTYIRGAYAHVGKAGMLMNFDLDTGAPASSARHSTVQQSNSQQGGS